MRIWAARHMVQGAQVHAGLRAAGEVLGELVIHLEQDERRAMTRILVERLRIGARGMRPTRKPRPLRPRERLALEALHGLSAPVRATNYMPGSLLVMQYLRRALIR